MGFLAFLLLQQSEAARAIATDTEFHSHLFPKLFNLFLPNWWLKQGEIHIDVTIGISNGELLFVYEYIPNGTVADHIHGHQATPGSLTRPTRMRAREGGVVCKMTSVHMVSAVRDWGLKNLVEDMVKLAGPRGNVWAIGAQNAGKSTLINSIGEHVGGARDYI
nr:gtp-binding protein brassinazole insensitive pale green 2, chloroplastic [Quercus suber]